MPGPETVTTDRAEHASRDPASRLRQRLKPGNAGSLQADPAAGSYPQKGGKGADRQGRDGESGKGGCHGHRPRTQVGFRRNLGARRVHVEVVR